MYDFEREEWEAYWDNLERDEMDMPEEEPSDESLKI